jgi:hypothetical protein
MRRALKVFSDNIAPAFSNFGTLAFLQIYRARASISSISKAIQSIGASLSTNA